MAFALGLTPGESFAGEFAHEGLQRDRENRVIQIITPFNDATCIFAAESAWSLGAFL
jgi:hypothetical protein